MTIANTYYGKVSSSDKCCGAPYNPHSFTVGTLPTGGLGIWEAFGYINFVIGKSD